MIEKKDRPQKKKKKAPVVETKAIVEQRKLKPAVLAQRTYRYLTIEPPQLRREQKLLDERLDEVRELYISEVEKQRNEANDFQLSF